MGLPLDLPTGRQKKGVQLPLGVEEIFRNKMEAGFVQHLQVGGPLESFLFYFISPDPGSCSL